MMTPESWARASGDGLKIDALQAELERLRRYLAALETDPEFRCSIGPLDEWDGDV